MVGLDGRGPGAAARLDHVRVESALNEEVNVIEAVCLLLEDADEFGPDELALALRIRHTGQPGQKAVSGVDRHQRHLEVVAEGGDDLLALVLAHQAVIDEHAGETVSDGAVNEQRGDTRVDSAREPADGLPIPDLGADPGNLILDDRGRAPGPLATADLLEEGVEHLLPVRSVDHLGVKLDAVDPPLGVLEGGHRGRGRGRESAKPGRRREHRVPMRHPAGLLRRRSGQQAASFVHGEL